MTEHPTLIALNDYLAVYDLVCSLARKEARIDRCGTDQRNPYEVPVDTSDPGASPDDQPIGESDLLGLHGYWTAQKGDMERQLTRWLRQMVDGEQMHVRRMEDWQEGRRRMKGAWNARGMQRVVKDAT